MNARLSGDGRRASRSSSFSSSCSFLGILAAIAIPAFFNQRDKATDADAKTPRRTAQTAMETYATDNGGVVDDSAGGADATPTALENIEGTLPEPTWKSLSTGRTNTPSSHVRDGNRLLDHVGRRYRHVELHGSGVGGCPTNRPGLARHAGAHPSPKLVDRPGRERRALRGPPFFVPITGAGRLADTSSLARRDRARARKALKGKAPRRSRSGPMTLPARFRRRLACFPPGGRLRHPYGHVMDRSRPRHGERRRDDLGARPERHGSGPGRKDRLAVAESGVSQALLYYKPRPTAL
jgi:type II secretory pathway pseudopilin PulG